MHALAKLTLCGHNVRQLAHHLYSSSWSLCVADGNEHDPLSPQTIWAALHCNDAASYGAHPAPPEASEDSCNLQQFDLSIAVTG